MRSAAGSSASDTRILRLASSWDPEKHSLSPAEGFLLSRIDGRTPWTVLRHIGGLPPEDVDAYLQRWLDEGIVVFSDCEVVRTETRDAAESRRTEPTSEADRRIDPGLDIDTDLQRRILDFEGSLDRSYFELLDVSTDADTKEIKRAYFRLSKVFHPDRYFRRQLGEYKGRLDRIFKKLVEAYELLSDPTTRAEVERSMSAMIRPTEPVFAEANATAAEAVAEEATPTRTTPQKLSRRQTLERLRRHFMLPEKIMAERRFKAAQFYKAALVAAHKEVWKEAAPSLRLAIAFDPWNDEYRIRFAEIQAHYHEQRAEEILAENDSGWDAAAQAEALRLIEEVLIYRPADAAVNARAAGLALGLDDLEKALEYAETACELSPESASHRLTLGRILRRAGTRDKAIEVLKSAARLDRDDREIQAELRDIRRSKRRTSGGA